MKVALRPLRQSDFELLATDERDEVPTPFDDFGFRGPGAMRRRFAEDGYLPASGDNGRLAVTVDEALAGEVSWHTVRYGPNEASRALNIGIVLLPASRLKGIGRVAITQLCTYLFENFSVNRIECATDVENLAAQRMVERAGFRREGVARGAQYRRGTYHDLVVYSHLRPT